MEESDADRMVSGSEGRGGPGEIAPGQLGAYYKNVVGQIEITLPQEKSRVIMLSSSVYGEGTTDVTMGLGMTAANEMGRKTVIVDCNLQHPEVHLRFGVPDVGVGNT